MSEDFGSWKTGAHAYWVPPKSDFCRYCGARIPPIPSEGTCIKCCPTIEEKTKK